MAGYRWRLFAVQVTGGWASEGSPFPEIMLFSSAGIVIVERSANYLLKAEDAIEESSNITVC
jgi:hypothetical protein